MTYIPEIDMEIKDEISIISIYFFVLVKMIIIVNPRSRDLVSVTKIPLLSKVSIYLILVLRPVLTQTFLANKGM
jgi:hypothetical protein